MRTTQSSALAFTCQILRGFLAKYHLVPMLQFLSTPRGDIFLLPLIFLACKSDLACPVKRPVSKLESLRMGVIHHMLNHNVGWANGFRP